MALRNYIAEVIQPPESTLRRVVAAHPVNSAAGWRRCRAKKDAWIRSGVRVEPRHGPCEELEEIGYASGDRAAPIVRVLVLEVARVHHVPREDPVAKARREALDLGL